MANANQETLDTEYMPPDIGQSTLGSNNMSINSINEAATFEMVKQSPMDYNYQYNNRIKKISYASSYKSTQRQCIEVK